MTPEKAIALLDEAMWEREMKGATFAPSVDKTPFPGGPEGIETRGCPKCKGTMWLNGEGLFICKKCGHVVGKK